MRGVDYFVGRKNCKKIHHSSGSMSTASKIFEESYLERTLIGFCLALTSLVELFTGTEPKMNNRECTKTFLPIETNPQESDRWEKGHRGCSLYYLGNYLYQII